MGRPHQRFLEAQVRWRQIALLNCEPPYLQPSLAIGCSHHQARTIPQHLQVGYRRPHLTHRLPAAVLVPQLQLFSPRHHHHGHHPWAGIPSPALRRHGQLAPIPAAQLQFDQLIQPGAGAEQQSPLAALPKPAMGQRWAHAAAGAHAAPLHRPTEAQIQRPNAGTGQGRLDRHQARGAPDQQLLLRQTQHQAGSHQQGQGFHGWRRGASALEGSFGPRYMGYAAG